MSLKGHYFAVGILILAGVALHAQEPAITSGEVLPAKRAQELLKGIKLQVLGQPAALKKSREECCFGLRTPQGTIFLGESCGEDYGIHAMFSGTLYELVGFLYCDADFLLSDKNLTKGPHAVFVSPGKLATPESLFADPRSIDLNTLIDESLFSRTPKGNKPLAKRPRFSLVQDEQGIFLLLESNKIPIAIK
jgi:hypothetical protein